MWLQEAKLTGLGGLCQRPHCWVITVTGISRATAADTWIEGAASLRSLPACYNAVLPATVNGFRPCCLPPAATR